MVCVASITDRSVGDFRFSSALFVSGVILAVVSTVNLVFLGGDVGGRVFSTGGRIDEVESLMAGRND